jgi:hypothetical protein
VDHDARRKRPALTRIDRELAEIAAGKVTHGSDPAAREAELLNEQDRCPSQVNAIDCPWRAASRGADAMRRPSKKGRVPPTVAAEQIDAILPFLNRFSADGFVVGKMRCDPGKFPWYEFSNTVTEFQQCLYDNGWVTAFEWPEWQDVAKEYVDLPHKIEQADADTIRKLFTTHVRKERFCDGHLAEMFESGHIVALLRRLQEIRRTMA